jgi:hypothetical protein
MTPRTELAGLRSHRRHRSRPRLHLARLDQTAADDASAKDKNGPQAITASGVGEAQATWLVPVAWLAVWLPLGWGIWVTLQKAVLLFK